MNEQVNPRPTWKVVIAAILDFITVFFVGGYIIGYLTGGLTEEGFSLSGLPALLLFAVVVAYFWVLTKYLGGTIWRRIFGIA